MKIRLNQDSRDLHGYQHFGQTVPIDLPASENFDDPAIPQHIQPVGDVECTCFTVEYVAQNRTKAEYDIQELFSRVPHNAFGATPQDVLGEVIKNGLKRKDTGEYEKPYTSWFRADTGNFDSFHNALSNMQFAESPVMIWTNWYQEWMNLTPGAIMPIGKTPVSGHMYAGLGWSEIKEGVTVLTIEFWGGYTLSMPDETFNAAIKERGCGSAIFSDQAIDRIRKRNIIEYLIDLWNNLLIVLTPMNDYNTPPEQPKQEIVTIQPTKGNYLWDTPENARHSVRVICDEERLDLEEKDTMCATIGAESGWQNYYLSGPKKGQPVTHENYIYKIVVGTDGIKLTTKVLASTDWGICQWNDKYHGDEISPDEALKDPEKAVRLMCKYWKMGEPYRNWWIAYKNGSYKQYL